MLTVYLYYSTLLLMSNTESGSYVKNVYSKNSLTMTLSLFVLFVFLFTIYQFLMCLCVSVVCAVCQNSWHFTVLVSFHAMPYFCLRNQSLLWVVCDMTCHHVSMLPHALHLPCRYLPHMFYVRVYVNVCCYYFGRFHDM